MDLQGWPSFWSVGVPGNDAIALAGHSQGRRSGLEGYKEHTLDSNHLPSLTSPHQLQFILAIKNPIVKPLHSLAYLVCFLSLLLDNYYGYHPKKSPSCLQTPSWMYPCLQVWLRFRNQAERPIQILVRKTGQVPQSSACPR